ncbi:MAG TPA: hypothetical protein VND65_09000 [Candidatus Binatia bacterium]|nr:hypothetical protein [Candidatus Binatia bacterium]
MSSDRVASESQQEAIARSVSTYGPQEIGDLWVLANSHHVIMRSFPRLHSVMKQAGNPSSEPMERAIEKERARIDHALSFLTPICATLSTAGRVVVIKSLDHWPDFGSDIDLYTNADSSEVVALMAREFQARLEERSWGDRLANKWNFIVPGLPELVEVHVGRLGQTGEQVAITNSLVKHAHPENFGRHTFVVPAAEDRLMITTLQRMYRHFYLRLCDIADTTRLADSDAIDYEYLHSLADPAGLWDGLATYLETVSGYVKQYRGFGLDLPPLVTDAARFGADLVHFRRKFLRIPIFPQAAGLYMAEWRQLLLNGEWLNALRLSLLPGLAAAAAIELKLTGSDKGIW